MAALRFSWAFLGVLVLVIVAVDLLILGVGYATHFRHFNREDGPLETVQLIVLAVAVLGFAGLAFRASHAARLIACGAMSLCLLFFFREFETPVDNPVLDFMSSDPFLYLLTAILGLFMAVQLYLNRAHIPAFLGWLMRIEWWPFLLAGTFLVVAEIFEKSHVPLIEEMLELNGHLILATTAIAAWYRSGAKVRIATLRPA